MTTKSRHYQFLVLHHKRKAGNSSGVVKSVLGMFFQVVFRDGDTPLSCTVHDFDETGFDFAELRAETGASQETRYELTGKYGSVEFKDIKVLLGWDEKPSPRS